MWGLPSFIFLFAFFHRAAPGTVAKELMHEFDASGTIVGLLAATYFYSYAAFMIPAGVLIDAYGARRIVSCVGTVTGLGTLAMAAASSSMLLFAGRLVIGLGATVTFIGAVKIAAAWFPPSRFGTLSAMMAPVGILGSILAKFPLAALVVWVGWRGASVMGCFQSPSRSFSACSSGRTLLARRAAALTHSRTKLGRGATAGGGGAHEPSITRSKGS